MSQGNQLFRQISVTFCLLLYYHLSSTWYYKMHSELVTFANNLLYSFWIPVGILVASVKENWWRVPTSILKAIWDGICMRVWPTHLYVASREGCCTNSLHGFALESTTVNLWPSVPAQTCLDPHDCNV